MIVHSLLFVLYSTVYILLPGVILLKKTGMKFKDNSLCHTVLLSYFLGLGLLIAEYWVCSLAKAFWLFAAISPVFLLLFAVLGRRRLAGELRRRRRPDGKKVIAYLLVLLICYTLSFIYITLPYGDLLSKSYVDIGQDFFNHTGLVASLSKGLPAGDLKVSGVTLYYHYFQDLMFGMCENIFGIPAFDLVMQCTPLMVSAVFGTALFCLLKGERQTYRKRDIVHSVCRCCFFFVFGGAWSLPLTGAGYQEGYWNWSNYHIFTSVNAGAFGLAALIAVLIFLKNAELDQTAPGQIAVLTVLTAVATGAKGPFSVVFVASFVAVYLVKVVVERNINKALACYVASSTAAFAATYFLVIHGTSLYGQSKTTQVEILLRGTLDRTAVASFAPVGLFSIPFVDTLLRLALVAFIAFGPLLLYALFSFADEMGQVVKNRRMDDVFTCVCIAMVAIGGGGFLFVNQSGYSQDYFLFAAIGPLVYLALGNVAQTSGQRRRGIFCLSLIALFGMHLLLSDVRVQLRTGLTERGWLGYSQTLEPSVRNISADERRGLEWIYCNTPGDATFLTDRRSVNNADQYKDDCLFFGYSALAERQMFLEGFSYSSVSEAEVRKKIAVTEAIYASTGEETEALMKENGIDYVIVTKRMGTDFRPTADSVELCFENDGMRLYRLSDR